jgi:prevent-host-death family protein
MKTLPLSEVKMKLSSLVEAVHTADEEIVITRNGRPTAVLISAEEFESMKETLAVRSDRDLMKEIQEGITALKKKRCKLYTLEDLLKA